MALYIYCRLIDFNTFIRDAEYFDYVRKLMMFQVGLEPVAETCEAQAVLEVDGSQVLKQESGPLLSNDEDLENDSTDGTSCYTPYVSSVSASSLGELGDEFSSTNTKEQPEVRSSQLADSFERCTSQKSQATVLYETCRNFFNFKKFI